MGHQPVWQRAQLHAELFFHQIYSCQVHRVRAEGASPLELFAKEKLKMTDYRVRAGEVEEDQITGFLESYSSKWPSSFFLGAAGASILGSLILKIQGKEEHALFVGQWAAPFLILGLYNKVVKQHGSDAVTRG
jgi:hypothetical protein